MLEHQFKDTSGEVWTINITVKEYRAIKAEFGVDISNIISESDNWISDMMTGADMVQFCGIIWLLCETQADKREVSMEDFFSRLDGDCVGSATDAMLEGVINFTAAPQRESLRQIARLTKETIGMAAEKVLDHLPLVKEEIQKQLDEKFEEIIGQVPRK